MIPILSKMNYLVPVSSLHWLFHLVFLLRLHPMWQFIGGRRKSWGTEHTSRGWWRSSTWGRRCWRTTSWGWRWWGRATSWWGRWWRWWYSSSWGWRWRGWGNRSTWKWWRGRRGNTWAWGWRGRGWSCSPGYHRRNLCPYTIFNLQWKKNHVILYLFILN